MPVTYTQLTGSKSTAGSLKSWINRETIDPDTILTEAQALIYGVLRHWKMKADETASMTIGADSITLPAEFIDMRDLRITGAYAGRMKKADERWVQDRYAWDSAGARIRQRMQYYYLSGLAAVFDSPADIAYPLLISYYARPAELSSINTTNFLTTDAPRLLRSACMLIAVEFEKEVGQGQFDRTYWQQQFDMQIAKFQAASDVVDHRNDLPSEIA